MYAEGKVADLRQRDMLSTHSRFNKWTPVTVLEMY